MNEAKVFAMYAHDLIEQKRKYTGEPYWHHCRNVAYLVSLFTDDQDMINASWLHDVIEDISPYRPEIIDEMIRIFSEKTIKLVYELTDVSRPEDGNRAERKRIDREHIASASNEAKTIKLADLIDNTRSIVSHDLDFARIYLEEKRLLLEVLKNGSDPNLYNLARSVYLNAINKLKGL